MKQSARRNQGAFLLAVISIVCFNITGYANEVVEMKEFSSLTRTVEDQESLSHKQALVDQAPILPRLQDDFPLTQSDAAVHQRERENAMEAAIRASQKAAGPVEIGAWESVEADVIGHMRAQKYREMMKDMPTIGEDMSDVVEDVLEEIDLEISMLQKQLFILDLQIEEVRQQCEAELGMPGCVSPPTSAVA